MAPQATFLVSIKVNHHIENRCVVIVIGTKFVLCLELTASGNQ